MILYIFAAIAALFCFFAWALAWARRDTHWRHTAIVAVLVLLPGLAVAAVESQGWHKSIGYAWRLDGKQVVLAHKLVYGEAIYLYLDIGPGAPKPVVMPWDDKTVERLQKALRESERRGRKGAIMQFDHSWEQRPAPQFYPLPQPQTPMPKQAPPEPKRYERV